MDNRENGENVSNDFSFTTFFTSCDDIKIIFHFLIFLYYSLIIIIKKKDRRHRKSVNQIDHPPITNRKKENACSMIFKF